jgi:hypothetical protein
MTENTSPIRTRADFERAVREYGVDPNVHRWEDYQAWAQKVVKDYPVEG